MSAPEPYDWREMTDDARRWALATPGQQAAAFFDLLAAATSVALHEQNGTLIETLREIRTARDGA